MHVPERTCAGCGGKAPQADLVRLTARDGRLARARPGEPGRSVYTHPRLACFERAAARRAFSRTLRQTVHVDPGLARLYTERDDG